MKVIIISLFLVAATTAQAQFVQYTPVTTPTTPKSNSYSYSDPFSDIDAEIARHHYQNQVVESDIINSCAINPNTGNVYSIQVKTEMKRNGNYTLKCIGIKMNNKWISCESDLSDLRDAYKEAKTQSDKSFLLELMEIANFAFIYNKTLYLIPKPEQ
ncbi:MAG: hypothetical protein IJ693_03755 [Bacteroidaceae bacterium]|nr:hypothetical protein [Bacteroidaceae bacterium]